MVFCGTACLTDLVVEHPPKQVHIVVTDGIAESRRYHGRYLPSPSRLSINAKKKEKKKGDRRKSRLGFNIKIEN